MTTPVAPSRVIKVLVSSVTNPVPWTTVDAFGFTGSPYRWTVVLSVTVQPISWVLSSTPYSYTGTDIIVGDWLSNETGGMAWKIISISAATTSSVTCVVEDIGRYNTLSDPSQSGDGAPPALINGFVFAVNSVTGQPILSPVIENVLTSQFQSDLQGRFLTTNPPSASSGAGNGFLNDGTLSGTVLFDLSSYTVLQGTVTGGAITLGFSNFPVGKSVAASLIVSNGGLATWTFGASGQTIEWPGGIVPTFSSAGTDIVSFMSTDGTTFFATLLGANFANLAVTMALSLEDGSGYLILEDASGYLIQEP